MGILLHFNKPRPGIPDNNRFQDNPERLLQFARYIQLTETVFDFLVIDMQRKGLGKGRIPRKRIVPVR